MTSEECLTGRKARLHTCQGKVMMTDDSKARLTSINVLLIPVSCQFLICLGLVLHQMYKELSDSGGI